MSKSLSEMLDNFQVKITQIRALENEAYVDRESFLKIKRVAIELSKACEITNQNMHMHSWCINHGGIIIRDSISRAKDILESR